MVRCRYTDDHGVRCSRDAGNNIYCERHKHYIDEIITTSVNICRANGVDIYPIAFVCKELIDVDRVSALHDEEALPISNMVKTACMGKGFDMLQADLISAVIVDACKKYGLKAK